MEWTTETDKFAIVKGFIDARDSNSRQIHGAFVSASGYQRQLYLKEMFTETPIDRTLSWPELLAMLNDEGREPPENSVLMFYKQEFHEFLDLQRLLEYGRGRQDAKEIERRITYFCSDALGLSAITFLELTMTGEGELLAIMPFLSEKLDGTEEKKEKDLDDHDAPSVDDLADTEEDGEEKETHEIFLACEPVLDPIAGVAVGNLLVGDSIAVKLPEESAFHQFSVNKYPEFDGVIEGQITGIKINEYNTAIVALKLADGISGALKLSGKVRIKRLAVGESVAHSRNARFSAEIIFAALGVAVFLVVVGVLLYIID